MGKTEVVDLAVGFPRLDARKDLQLLLTVTCPQAEGVHQKPGQLHSLNSFLQDQLVQRQIGNRTLEPGILLL